MREEANLNLLVPNSSLIVYNSLVLYVGVMVGNFFSLDIFFRLRRSILVNFQYFSARGGKDIMNHPVPEGELFTDRETWRHLYCMRVVGVGSFCFMNLFRWRRNFLINFLNYDCLFSFSHP